MPKNKDLEVSKTKALANVERAGKDIDKIVEQTRMMSTKQAANFAESLVIARGVRDLRNIFFNVQEIEAVVMAMANNRLGFLTDRSPQAIRKNQRAGKGPQREYSYKSLVDPVIEGLLKGYRISGNEMNVISGQFYAAKNGTYRLITEWPNLSNFVYNNDPVELVGQKAARVKCWAKWLLAGEPMSMGIEDDDPCVFQVRVNYGMGEDAVVGKAHAKLFKRVLERISGQVQPEVTEIYPSDYFVHDDAKPVTRDPLKKETAEGERNLQLYQSRQKQPAPKKTDAPTHAPAQEKAPTKTEEEQTDPDDSQGQLEKAFDELIDAIKRSFTDKEKAVEAVKAYAKQRDITIYELALELQAFPSTWEEIVAYVQHADVFTEQEQPDQEEASQKPEPTPEPSKKDKTGNWWEQVNNWSHKRATPFLYLVRVGIGLPHKQMEITHADGDVWRLDQEQKYRTEIKENPGALGSLMSADPEVVDRVRQKVARMGFFTLLDDWIEEFKESKERGFADKPKLPSEQIKLPLNFSGPEDVVQAYNDLAKHHPEIMAKVVSLKGLPGVTGDALDIIEMVKAQVKYADQGKF